MPEDAEQIADAEPGATAAPAQFRWYMTGQACWFFGAGLNIVLFPWLAALVLKAPPELVGVVQMSTMLPSVLLLLYAGVIADRHDIRSLLVRLQCLAAVPSLLLAWALAFDVLNLALLIGMGLALGTVLAFVVPARDALLTRVAPGSVQKAVVQATLAQFAFMLVGIVCAGFADLVGGAVFLLLHAGFNLLGAFAARRLAPAPAIHRAARRRVLAEIREGLAAVVSDPRLGPVVVVQFAVGVCYVGSFLVVLPIQVRDVYGGGAADLTIINTCFWVGTIAATASLLRLGHMNRPGRIMMISVIGGVVILALIGVPGSFLRLGILCLIWGLGAGVIMSMGRSMVQQFAPPAQRARVLAIYQLGFSGGAPLGALAVGYLVKYLGPHDAAFVPAGIMLVVGLALLATSRLWALQAPRWN